MKAKIALGLVAAFAVGYKVGTKSIDAVWAKEIADKAMECNACKLSLQHLRGGKHGRGVMPVGPSPRATAAILHTYEGN